MAKQKQVLTREQAEEFTHNLGQITAGDYGLIDMAVNTLGVPQALGKSTEEWINESLGGYVRWTVDQRRDAVKNLTADGKSSAQISMILGISTNTVDRDRAVNKALLPPEGEKPALSEDNLPPEGEVAEAPVKLKKLAAPKRKERVREMIGEGKTDAQMVAAFKKEGYEVGLSTISKERAEIVKYEEAKKAEADRVANLTPAEQREIEAAQDAITAPVKKALGGFVALSIVNHLEQATEDIGQMISDGSVTVDAVEAINQALDAFRNEFRVAEALIGQDERKSA